MNLKSLYVKIMDESILFFLQGFSLNILSRSSLHFVGIRGIYIRVRMECEELGFSKQSWLATWPRDLTESRVQAASKQNCQTGLFVLQCSSWRDYSSSLHASLVCIIWRLARREFQSRVPATLHKLEHFFTFSHTLPLHDSHLNIGLLIAKLQENLSRNKANKMVD